jgi:hypothetical protein
MKKSPRRFILFRGTTLLLIVLVAAFAAVWTQRLRIEDAIKLHNYTPSVIVSSLAAQTTMTDYGQHMFFINHPAVEERTDFNSNCQAHSEKTIVLGCYHSNQAGIFLFHVTDERLNGVEQVTAAHEMLHAAYNRLSEHDKTQVDSWLMDYYEHDLQDPRIKTTIEAYKVSEPTEVVNEMHSVFGTEVANLPPQLENYYKRYFTNRSAVVAYGNKYDQEFTNRETQVKQDDAILKGYKTQIDANNAKLDSLQGDIKVKQVALSSEKASGNLSAYNAGVDPFNQEIDTYNALATATTTLINEYNSLVKTRNDLAGEVNQLAQAINSQPAAIAN